jgi:hypothetical protein
MLRKCMDCGHLIGYIHDQDPATTDGICDSCLRIRKSRMKYHVKIYLPSGDKVVWSTNSLLCADALRERFQKDNLLVVTDEKSNGGSHEV